MKRSDFLKYCSLGLLAPYAMTLNDLEKMTSGFTGTNKMPILFVGHGNPMNAISENSFTQGWANVAKNIPKPAAILCVSAHWLTRGTHVTAMEQPKTIHDFGGFPKELFAVQYPAPGSPETAKLVQESITTTHVGADHEWGLDHGTWSVLVKMYPEADIPVLQLSIDYPQTGKYHYELGKQLANLRRKGILIVASGNIVHNLRMAKFEENPTPYDWAIEFDDLSKKLIANGEHDKLMNYQTLGEAAKLSIPTPDHYYPLMYILGLQEKGEEVQFFNEELAFGSGSMRSLIIQ